MIASYKSGRLPRSYNSLVLVGIIVAITVGWLSLGGGLGSGGEEVTTPSGAIALNLQEWGYNQAKGGPTIEAERGERVVITITNVGTILHNIYIEEFDLDVDISPGESTTVSFNAEKTGTFTYLCNIPGHKEAGMISENGFIVKEKT